MLLTIPPPPGRPPALVTDSPRTTLSTSRRVLLFVSVLFLGWLGLHCHGEAHHPQSVPVAAFADTDPVPSDGDAADDAAIWVHPEHPERSTILGTDKKEGLAVYDLAGRQLQFLADGNINNVDVRQGVPWGDGSADLAAATNKSHNGIAVYRIVDDGRALELVGLQPLGGIEIIEAEGICLYRSATTGRLYAVVTGKEGHIEQWWLAPGPDGSVAFERVRTWNLGVPLEGCVADDDTGRLYIGAEEVGVWIFGAEPDADTGDPELLDSVGFGGHLRHDVEGLALYRQPGGRGYLLASSQGSDDFVVYDRSPPHRYRGRFHVALAGIDGDDPVTHTDGIEVSSADLGGDLRQGLLVVQDDEVEGGRQNFKLVPWSAVAKAVGLEAPLADGH